MNPSDPRERVKFWLDPQLDNLELLRATYYTYAFTPHIHDTYAIGVTVTGAQAYTRGHNQHWIMPAGSIAIVHPGEVHTSQAGSEQGWTYRMFYPRAALLQTIAAELAGRPRDLPFFPAPVIFDTDLARQMQAFHAALEDPATLPLERESRFLSLLGRLIARHAGDRSGVAAPRPEPVYIRRVREYLDQCYPQAVTLADLSGLVGMSTFHLLRVFRSTTGLSPHAYLVHLRIERARLLLRQGMPPAAVAAETGFVDQSHFSKSFKRIVGVTPAQYCAGQYGAAR